MHDIFISYSRKDIEYAKALADDLKQEGFTVWWDRSIPAGRTFDDVIDEAIKAAKCIIVIWSKISVQSEWVRTEAGEGHTKRILVPVMVEEVEIPLAFRRVQAANLVGWNKDHNAPAFVKLVDDIKAIIKSHEPTSSAIESTEQREATEPIRSQETYASPTPTHPISKSSKPNKSLIILGVVIVALIAVFFGTNLKDQLFSSISPNNNAEKKDPIITTTTNTSEKPDEKTNTPPINEVNDETNDWKSAVDKNTVESYAKYIVYYGEKGRFIEDARKRIKGLKEKNIKLEIEKTFNSSKETNTVLGYIEFIMQDFNNEIRGDTVMTRYKNKILTSYKERAVKELESIGKKGWLYSGRVSTDKVKSDRMFDLIFREGAASIEKTTKPQKGDIVKYINVDGRRTYKQSSPRNSSSGSINKNQLAYVIDLKMEGRTALILQIIY